MKPFLLVQLIGVLLPKFLQQPQQLTRDFSGNYRYSVVDTPYGEFFGSMTLKKNGELYVGSLVNNHGQTFTVKFVRARGNSIVFKSNFENANSLFLCRFSGDSLRAYIEVEGDTFVYTMKGNKETGTK
jgi:hypothetical protein